MHKGKLINLEGIDGAGKTTFVAFIQNILCQSGREVVVTREPGGTAIGEKLREMLLHEKMHLETEALLMFAARREHIAQIIEPALARGAYVLTDRFTDSSFAFQGGGRKLAIEKMETLEQWVHPDLQPDLTFLFDVPTDVAQQRMAGTRSRDRFEEEKVAFHSDVRNEYLRRAAQFPDRFRILDATKSIAELQITIQSVCIEVMDAWKIVRPATSKP